MLDLFQAVALNMHAYFAAASDACTKNTFFFIPHWWEYLKTTASGDQCSIDFHFPGDIFGIALAVLDILLRLAGFIAVVMIILAGFQYIFSLGNPEKITNSRKRITNGLIGLAIAFVATLAVTFIGREFVK